uniref:Uncharacterized protein n=1 Tax=Anguilla anguilla TaxID=7936 RepID=A0A0E9TIE8_ANGAN
MVQYTIIAGSIYNSANYFTTSAIFVNNRAQGRKCTLPLVMTLYLPSSLKFFSSIPMPRNSSSHFS